MVLTCLSLKVNIELIISILLLTTFLNYLAAFLVNFLFLKSFPTLDKWLRLLLWFYILFLDRWHLKRRKERREVNDLQWWCRCCYIQLNILVVNQTIKPSSYIFISVWFLYRLVNDRIWKYTLIHIQFPTSAQHIKESKKLKKVCA